MLLHQDTTLWQQKHKRPHKPVNWYLSLTQLLLKRSRTTPQIRKGAIHGGVSWGDTVPLVSLKPSFSSNVSISMWKASPRCWPVNQVFFSWMEQSCWLPYCSLGAIVLSVANIKEFSFAEKFGGVNVTFQVTEAFHLFLLILFVFVSLWLGLRLKF